MTKRAKIYWPNCACKFMRLLTIQGYIDRLASEINTTVVFRASFAFHFQIVSFYRCKFNNIPGTLLNTPLEPTCRDVRVWGYNGTCQWEAVFSIRVDWFIPANCHHNTTDTCKKYILLINSTACFQDWHIKQYKSYKYKYSNVRGTLYFCCCCCLKKWP